MADEKTHADSVRMYLTGASTHFGTQADPNLSLGNHQASTEVVPVANNVSSPIAGIAIDYVAGANGLGAGSLTASGADDLKWTPPGGTQGVAQTILNGETKIIEGGASAPEKYVRVSRTSATALTGTATVTITDKANNVFGFDDVTAAEQLAGDDEYRAVAIENVSAASVNNVKVKLLTLGTQITTDGAQLGATGSGTITTTGTFSDWPSAGYAAIKTSGGTLREVVYYSSRTTTSLTIPAAGRALLGSTAAAGTATDTADSIPGIALGLDAPASQPAGAFVDNTGTGEDAVPAGVTFSVPITDAEALSIGTLASLEIYGVWMHREIPAGATAGPGFVSGISFSFDSV